MIMSNVCPNRSRFRIPTFAQVTAFPPEVCKIVGVRLPRFESWICHAKAQVSAGRTSRLPVFGNGAPDRRLTVQHAVQAGQRPACTPDTNFKTAPFPAAAV